MQNDFLAREILPNCFTSDSSEISMEAEAKENFSENIDLCATHFHYTLLYGNIQQKKQNFLSRKRKSPENLGTEVFGKRLFVYDGNGFHSLGLQGLVGPVGRNTRDAVKNVKAVGQLAECGVGAVQMGRVLVHDEEL